MCYSGWLLAGLFNQKIARFCIFQDAFAKIQKWCKSVSKYFMSKHCIEANASLLK